MTNGGGRTRSALGGERGLPCASIAVMVWVRGQQTEQQLPARLRGPLRGQRPESWRERASERIRGAVVTPFVLELVTANVQMPDSVNNEIRLSEV